MSQAVKDFFRGQHAAKIFLVGMPGCGKSTVGKVLAARLGYTFLDLDTLLEGQEKLTVPQVFEQKGQEYFRQAEAKALRTAAALPESIVLATGGGAPCFCKNMAFMEAHGTVVYLKISPQELLGRLTEQDLQARPLLRDKTPQELLQYLSQTLEYREQFYCQATYTITAGLASPAEVVKEIEQRLAVSLR